MLEMGRIERNATSETRFTWNIASALRARRQRSQIHPHAGRVLIDLMKVVQRDHKLDSYTPTPYLNTSSEIRKDDITQETFRPRRERR
jgi:DNA polymerase elongation subunit (family B)